MQNKIDLFPIEKTKENYNLIKKEFAGTIAENAPIIPVSAQQGINVERIFEAICNLSIHKRDTKETPLFLIARSFDINKPGANPETLHGSVL